MSDEGSRQRKQQVQEPCGGGALDVLEDSKETRILGVAGLGGEMR